MTWASKFGFVLICAIFVFSTLVYGTVHQPVIAAFYLAVGTAVAAWAIDGWKTGTVRLPRTVLPVPLLAAALYGLVQIIPFGMTEAAGVEYPRTISLDPFATQVTALHLLALFLFFGCVLVLLDSASRIYRMAAVITVFGFVYAFFAIIQSVLSPSKIYGIYESQSAVPFGSFVSRHNFAAFMDMAVAVPLGLLFAGAVRPDKRLLFITAAGLMGISLLLSGSRGGLVAFVAELIMLVMLTSGPRRRPVWMKIALPALLVAAVIGGALFVGGETSLTRFAETATAKDVTTGRSHIWSVTGRVIASNLPFGAGLGAFGVAYTAYDNLSGLERVEQAHNDYMQTAADMGIPGVLIGAAFLFLFFQHGRHIVNIGNAYRRGIAVGAFAGCFAILVHSIFDFVLHTTAISVLFLILLSLVSAALFAYPDDPKIFDMSHSGRRTRGKVAVFSKM